MRLLFIILLFSCVIFKSYATPIENLVSIDVAGDKLEGTLLTGESKKSTTVVLIIAGSGPTDRDGNNPIMVNNSLKMLADELLKIGVSSLRYDKRGVGKSNNLGLKESELRFENYIDDAVSWIDYLANSSRFNRIVVIGHSEGSLIGMVASQQESVDKFISIAGAGQPIDQIIREQLKGQPTIVLEASTPILDKLLLGDTVENVPEFLHPLFRPSVQPYMISWFQYDPQKEISKLNKPVLIVQGSEDLQVSLVDFDNLSSANKNAKKMMIKKMNHIFKEATSDRESNLKTYNQPELAINKSLVEVVGEFILN